MQETHSQYVRVSEILARLQNFDHIDVNVLEGKQLIGINVHEAISMSIKDDFPCISKKELGYFNSFERWRKATNPVFTLSETRFYDDELMITGQIDALVNFPNDSKNVLIDFKTSVSESPVIWPMQAHFYHYLLVKNNIPQVAERFLFIKLDKYGEMPKVYEYLFDSNLLNKCKLEAKIYWEEQKCRQQLSVNCILHS